MNKLWIVVGSTGDLLIHQGTDAPVFVVPAHRVGEVLSSSPSPTPKAITSRYAVALIVMMAPYAEEVRVLDNRPPNIAKDTVSFGLTTASGLCFGYVDTPKALHQSIFYSQRGVHMLVTPRGIRLSPNALGNTVPFTQQSIRAMDAMLLAYGERQLGHVDRAWSIARQVVRGLL